MKITSAEVLELEDLRRLLERYLSSPLGKKALEGVCPQTDRLALEEALAETAEAIEYQRAASHPSPSSRGAAVRLRFDALADPTEALAKLRLEGASLDAEEIRQLAQLLETASSYRRLLTAAAERFPRLAARARSLGEFHALAADLLRKFLPDGGLADHASPELARLRRQIEKQRRLIQDSLERFLRQRRGEDVLQEEFVAIRNERFVVPVIAGRKRRIDGVVHGASASGHTLFVEPIETIEPNNELVRITEAELREVHRILREMTSRLREQREAIGQAAAALGELELLFAKAAFAADFDCVIPRFSPGGAPRLALERARHPLLEDVLRRQNRRPVPVSVSLDGDCRTLLISGPNTGGKTLALKTAGLLALMAQSGLPVPAAGAEFPLFRQVLADIGDNQSIQESLSTYSAHIARIREMLEAARDGTLVLLDELGRATDPEEGGALGVAVLERFRAAGAFTLASTHLLALKIYGATTPGVVNASMGFDEQTLEPTYALKLGAPGKSAGLEIASRLGLPAAVVEDARSRLSSHQRDISQFLSKMQARLDELDRRLAELQAARDALEAERKSLAGLWAERESAKLKQLEDHCGRMVEKFESEARAALERIAGEAIRKRAASAIERLAGRMRRDSREELEAAALAARSEPEAGASGRPAIAEGARVRLRGIHEPAAVRRILEGDIIEVEAGFLRLQIPSSDVLEVLEPQASRPAPRRVTFDAAPLDIAAVREINVIGQHVDEARAQVEKFLDNATLADASRVRIVHGHGMGVLRRAIGELLSSHPAVEKFYPAEQREGGAGATIVELKS